MSKIGHGRNPGYRPGDNWDTCDRCELEFRASNLREEWTGLTVCEDCWEPRHEQDFLRVRPEKIVPDHVGTQNDTDSSAFTFPFKVENGELNYSFSVGGLNAFRGMQWKEDGTQWWFSTSNSGAANQRLVKEVTASTAFSLETSTITGDVGVVGTECPSSCGDFWIKDDGLHLYVLDVGGDEIEEYDVSVAFDVTGLVHDSSTSISAVPNGLLFDEAAGDFFWVVDSQDILVKFNMGTAYDTSSASEDSSAEINLRTSFGMHNVRSGCWNEDGTVLLIGNTSVYGDQEVWQFTCSTAYDPGTMSFLSKIATGKQPDGLACVTGTTRKFWVATDADNLVYEYTVATTFPTTEIPTATHTGSL